MKRRKILYGLTTILALFSFKNGIQRAQAQSSPVVGGNKNSIATASLNLRSNNTTYPEVIEYSLDSGSQLQQSSAQKVVLDNLAIADKNNQEEIYQAFLKAAAGGVENQPALMYQGINTSPYAEQIKDYPTRLMQRPDGKNLVSGIKVNDTFNSYPAVGKIPNINEQGLTFLHEDIKEACLCIGSFDKGGKFRAKWLGRNALACDEFWSSTKIIGLLNLVSHVNKKNPRVDFDSYSVRGIDTSGNQNTFRFPDLARDIVSYEKKIATSNSLGVMFKRFSLPLDLEKWLKFVTGNQDVIFRGRYGEKAFIEQPQLVKTTTNKVILNANLQLSRWQCNAVSAYDLTRLVSMLGWHNYIPRQSRLPDAEWKSLKTVITAMGADPARLSDLAIQILGLENDLESVAIISKLGNGNTATRERTEAVYVALVHCIDSRPKAFGKPAKLFTFTMALRGAKALQPRDPDREVVELDARMAAEVTEIVRRVLELDLA